uniref:Uncharacterized protein n=1 Tax=Physcomitrium patens TaxID=3218 RepID=A0A2K1J8U1_PHYPA|nr:hypothetical protein PHYPA_021051 [Physcomitrium patens]
MHAGTHTGSNVMVSRESGGTRGGGAGDSIERPASTPQQHHLEGNESDDTFESDCDSVREYPSPHSLVECELTEDLDDLDWSWDGISPWLPMCTEEVCLCLFFINFVVLVEICDGTREFVRPRSVYITSLLR